MHKTRRQRRVDQPGSVEKKPTEQNLIAPIKNPQDTSALTFRTGERVLTHVVNTKTSESSGQTSVSSSVASPTGAAHQVEKLMVNIKTQMHPIFHTGISNGFDILGMICV